jgi:predicted nucleic acid-binding protein
MDKFVFIDTSAHFALINSSDPDHKQAKQFLQKAADERYSFLTTNFIVSETYTLIRYRLGHSAAIKYIDNLISSPIFLERVSKIDEDKALQILKSYSDKDFSYVDATSFVVMKRLGTHIAFAFDNHFRQFGFSVTPH